jgi:hypothetical protein
MSLIVEEDVLSEDGTETPSTDDDHVEGASVGPIHRLSRLYICVASIPPEDIQCEMGFLDAYPLCHDILSRE